MVVVDDNVFSSSSNFNHTSTHHRRYLSIPTIKEVPNRNVLDPTCHKQNAFESRVRDTRGQQDGSPLLSAEGKAPSIISTLRSPTISRQPSIIKRKKRFMANSRELKSNFFYPVKAPRRKRSRKGKFRNSIELNASMNYVDIDSSMSKDLCLNQRVKVYEIAQNELLKMEPKLKETLKAITIDSINNYIIYTPNPALGKDSIISDAEQLLDQELLKLGTPIAFNNLITPVLPKYKIDRPFFNRYYTYPIAEGHSLMRTRSLPIKPSKAVNQQGVQGLWNLYLRRVIASRIKWRLQHMKTELQPRRPSMSSSVETGYFVNALLKNNVMLPPRGSSEETDSDTTEEDVDEPLTDDDRESKIVDQGSSHYSRSNESVRSSRELMGSLDSLLDEMRSLVEAQ